MIQSVVPAAVHCLFNCNTGRKGRVQYASVLMKGENIFSVFTMKFQLNCSQTDVDQVFCNGALYGHFSR